MRALGQHGGRLVGEQADQLFAVRACGVAAGERAATQKVLGGGDHAAHAQVVRRDRAIGVLAHDDVTLLGAQHVHGLGAVRRDVELRSSGHERSPNRRAVMRGHVDLKGQLAGEADAHDARRHTANRAFAVAHERESSQRQINVFANLLQHRARLGADQAEGAPLLGDAGHVDAHIGPLGLHPALHPAEHAGCAAAGGGHQETLFAQAHGDTVVKHHAVLIEHQAVAGFADFELEPGVGVHPVQQLGRVRALDINLAQCGRVHDAHAFAHGHDFAVHRLVDVFTGLGEIPGALPLAHVFKRRAAGHMVRVRAGVARRVEQIAAVHAGESAEGDGQVVGPEGGGADLADRLVQRAGRQCHAVDIAQLALVGAKAHGGVALDVLDGLKALAHSQLDVGCAHVILVIDERLGAARHRLAGLGNPERGDGLGHGFSDRIAAGLRGKACRASCACTRLVGSLQAAGHAEVRCACADDGLVGNAAAGLEAALRIVPPRFATGMGIQMDGRVPTTGHAQRVAGQAAARTTGFARVHGRDDDFGHRHAATGFNRHMAAQHADTGVSSLFNQTTRRRFARAGIDHTDAGTGLTQHQGVGIGTVVVRQQHDLASNQHAVQRGVVGHRRGQHHAGQVVVAKHHGALVRTRGQNHLLGAHAPQPFAKTAATGQRHMVVKRLAHR